ncbi:MAG: hypothetical protein R2766_11175 [Saprospiraceae bacterium]
MKKNFLFVLLLILINFSCSKSDESNYSQDSAKFSIADNRSNINETYQTVNNEISAEDIDAFVKLGSDFFYSLYSNPDFQTNFNSFMSSNDFTIQNIIITFGMDESILNQFNNYSSISEKFATDVEFQHMLMEKFNSYNLNTYPDLFRDYSSGARWKPCGLFDHIWGVASSAVAMAAGATFGGLGGLISGTIYAINTVNRLTNC